MNSPIPICLRHKTPMRDIGTVGRCEAAECFTCKRRAYKRPSDGTWRDRQTSNIVPVMSPCSSCGGDFISVDAEPFCRTCGTGGGTLPPPADALCDYQCIKIEGHPGHHVVYDCDGVQRDVGDEETYADLVAALQAASDELRRARGYAFTDSRIPVDRDPDFLRLVERQQQVGAALLAAKGLVAASQAQCPYCVIHAVRALNEPVSPAGGAT